MADDRPDLIAYWASSRPGVRIVPQSRWRDWMNATNSRSANRCLPLLMANESGWALLNPVAVELTWDGRMHPDGLTIEYDGDGPQLLSNGFGSGVATFTVPFLFRTSPGWNLLARGPANWPKDGIQALEGLVETDWSVATFTMNWKLTRPGQAVRFEVDEPYCVVLPQRRDELEAFRPSLRDIETDPDTATGTRAWVERRKQTHIRKFLAEYSKDFEGDWDAWEKDYFKGRHPDGSEAPEHQTKRRLAAFDG
jgi:Family of unknown function (DUF6065)